MKREHTQAHNMSGIINFNNAANIDIIILYEQE